LPGTATAHSRKRQFGFQKTRLRGMLMNRCKVNVMAAFANLFMARHLLLCKT
jgi:IS5 family transposase